MHPLQDPDYLAWRRKVQEMSPAERRDYEASPTAQIERDFKEHYRKASAHALSFVRERKGSTNARYLTNEAGYYQNAEDGWVYQNKYLGQTDEQALESAKAQMAHRGGAPRSFMTPDVLFRREMGDQARVAKRRPAAKTHRKVARPRQWVPNCVLRAMC